MKHGSLRHFFGGLAARLDAASTNSGPVHIGAQLFAGHRIRTAARRSLNRRAMLGRNIATPDPHVRRVVTDAYSGCQLGHAADCFDGSFKGFHMRKSVAHVRECDTHTNVLQEPAQISFVSKFPTRLKEARERAQLSQAALAKKAGVSAGSIGNWESGTRETPRSLIALADALGVDPAWLAGEDRPASRMAFNVKDDEPQHLVSVGQLAQMLAMALADTELQDRELIAQHIAHLVRTGPSPRHSTAIDALTPVKLKLFAAHPTKEGGSPTELASRTPYRSGATQQQPAPTEIGIWNLTERKEVQIDLDQPRTERKKAKS